MIEPLSLFYSKKESFYFVIGVFILFSINFSYEYMKFLQLSKSPLFCTKATVLNQYQKINKNKKRYTVLKLKSDDGFSFFTTKWKKLPDLKDKIVNVCMATKKIIFIGFLKGFYAPTKEIKLLKHNTPIKSSILHFIESQHKNSLTKELFLALFLAKPISKELRQKVQFLGVSHLIAISGFHLSVLLAIVYFLLFWIYKFFQDRYFPYRNAKFDLMVLSIGILFLYLFFIDFPPSLLRAFVLMVVGFFLYARAIKVISFGTLFLTVLFLIALNVRLLFSLGFWFSVSGVFYIFLFLHHFKELKSWQIFIFLNFWVYFMMIPVVHYCFDAFSFYQLLSPIVSMFFVVFYPIELFLHIIGFGDLLDEWILQFLSIEGEVYKIVTPFWFLVYFLTLSVFSIFNIRGIYLLFFSSLAFLVFV